MSEHSQNIWYVLRAENSRLLPTSFAEDEFFDLPKAGKLTATDLVKVPGSSVWQDAVTVKGLFRDHNDIRFTTVKEHLHRGDQESLIEGIVVLSEVIKDQVSSKNDERRAYWLRGECQQTMALQASTLSQAIALLESARNDFSQAVKTDPISYSIAMRRNKWFPQHPCYLPAYIDFLERYASDSEDRLASTRLAAVSALCDMGREAAPAIDALKSASANISGFEHSHFEDQLRQKFQLTIRWISQSSILHDSNASQSLRYQVEAAYEIYPFQAERFKDGAEFADEELARNERELVALLEHHDWKVRAKAACIIRCKVENPEPSTVQALIEHLCGSEKRANVRGHCALALTQFAIKGTLTPESFDQLITGLIERLSEDSAYPVQAIAAKTIVQIIPDTNKVVDTLIAVLSRPKVNRNLKLALVEAIGHCGRAAKEALPLVIQFTPTEWDGIEGELIKVRTILQIAPPGHPEVQKSIDTLVKNLREQPAATNVRMTRTHRDAALDAIVRVPMDEMFRRKHLLERMILDECPSIRCKAAQAIINIDKDLATQAGAYETIDRIGCR